MLAALLVALGHATGLTPLRFVTEIDLAIADARLRAFMPRTPDARIVVVDIDEKSLAEIGRWPWSRDHVAALTDELFARQHAAVVGFDVVFAEPDTSSGLPTLERLAAGSAPIAKTIAQALAPLRAELDFDARFAHALADRNAVLGFYLTGDRDGRRSGLLPAPAFDATLLQGRPIAFTRWDGYAANLPLFAEAAPAAGFFNYVPDPDGLVRAVPLIAELDGRHYEAIALAMYRLYTGGPAVRPGFATERWLAREYDALQSVLLEQATPQGTQRQAIPVDARVQARVPFRGPGGPHGGSFEYVSASDLLRQRVAPDHLKGKLVLVGSSAPGGYDQRATPVAEVYPGVEVHASLLSGLLDGRLPAQPDWASAFEVLQLLLVAGLLAWALPRLRAVRGAQLALGLVAVLVAANLWAYRANALLLPLASALLLAAALYVGTTVWGYVVEGRSRRSLARLFGSYVPPELVEEMARDPARYDMHAENRELTMMFCDMRDFTHAAEQLSPEDLRALVNAFFSTMTAAIRAQRGTLDKYIGDAIMAFWGAPLADPAHAAHATGAALAMAQRLAALNAQRRARGQPEIGMGIGLNTGTVCVGDMGSSMRRSYTVMGDAVNVAARIEGLTRHYGVAILAGEATRAAAGDAAPGDAVPGWRWVEVDRVRVKGKSGSVTLFTPLAAPPVVTPQMQEEARLWQLALAAYRLQHWGDAQAHLQALLSGFADSALAGLYRRLDERSTHYRATPPPAGWDGAHSFDNK
ncbi:MAG TPA: adenylate/guanylate cyclase domain-containing protein [Burkholderiaceae bacterium]|nr:adenylate/guanylate cyclase domain-containing protein [Burkholderiaceae bacterium]